MSEPKIETVAVGHARLWTATTGGGSTAVVLCHGGPGLSDNLGDLAGMIDDLAVVHRYDQRAGGRSTGEPPFTVEGFVDDLDALRAHWGHRSWVVAGHNWGGWLGLRYAMRYPSRVAAVITIGTPPPASEDWQETHRAERMARMTTEEQAFFEEQRSRRHAGEPLAAEDEQRWANLSWRVDFADPRMAEQHAPLFHFPVNHEVNRALNQEMDWWDATGEILAQLALIEVPVLLLHGARDPRPPAVSVAEALPHAELVVIPDAGHFPWIERPDDVRSTLRPFLRTVL